MAMAGQRDIVFGKLRGNHVNCFQRCVFGHVSVESQYSGEEIELRIKE